MTTAATIPVFTLDRARRAVLTWTPGQLPGLASSSLTTAEATMLLAVLRDPRRVLQASSPETDPPVLDGDTWTTAIPWQSPGAMRAALNGLAGSAFLVVDWPAVEGLEGVVKLGAAP